MATNNRSVRTYKKKDTTTSGTYPSSMAGNSYSAAIANKSNTTSPVIPGTSVASPSQSILNALSAAAKTGTTPNTAAGNASVGNPYSYTGNTAGSGSMAGNSYSAAIANKNNAVNSVKNYLDNLDKTYSLPETPTLPEVSEELEQEIQQTVSLPASMPTLSELPTFNSEYLDQLNALADKLTQMNYEDWTQGDQYQTLASRYGDMGRMSMQDVLGQIAGRTGGLASSYATSAAQQQYNDYMTQLEDVARSLYSSDRSDLMNDFSTLRNLYTDEYQRYRDTVEDEYQRYRDQVSDYLNLLSLQNSGSGSSGGSSGGSSYSVAGTTAPTVSYKESASGTGSTSFSNIKRTISGKLASGDKAGAANLISGVWNQLTSNQKKEIENTYGVVVSE